MQTFTVKISDPSNNLCTISNLRVEIKDINSIPPQPVLAKKLLDDAVSSGLSAAQHIIEKQILLNNYNFVANSEKIFCTFYFLNKNFQHVFLLFS
jgi:hypothetical protein